MFEIVIMILKSIMVVRSDIKRQSPAYLLIGNTLNDFLNFSYPDIYVGDYNQMLIRASALNYNKLFLTISLGLKAELSYYFASPDINVGVIDAQALIEKNVTDEQTNHIMRR